MNTYYLGNVIWCDAYIVSSSEHLLLWRWNEVKASIKRLAFCELQHKGMPNFESISILENYVHFWNIWTSQRISSGETKSILLIWIYARYITWILGLEHSVIWSEFHYWPNWDLEHYPSIFLLLFVAIQFLWFPIQKLFEVIFLSSFLPQLNTAQSLMCH